MNHTLTAGIKLRVFVDRAKHPEEFNEAVKKLNLSSGPLDNSVTVTFNYDFVHTFSLGQLEFILDLIKIVEPDNVSLPSRQEIQDALAELSQINSRLSILLNVVESAEKEWKTRK